MNLRDIYSFDSAALFSAPSFWVILPLHLSVIHSFLVLRPLHCICLPQFVSTPIGGHFDYFCIYMLLSFFLYRKEIQYLVMGQLFVNVNEKILIFLRWVYVKFYTIIINVWGLQILNVLAYVGVISDYVDVISISQAKNVYNGISMLVCLSLMTKDTHHL
jgi:hypothetical protein